MYVLHLLDEFIIRMREDNGRHAKLNLRGAFKGLWSQIKIIFVEKWNDFASDVVWRRKDGTGQSKDSAKIRETHFINGRWSRIMSKLSSMKYGYPVCEKLQWFFIDKFSVERSWQLLKLPFEFNEAVDYCRTTSGLLLPSPIDDS